MGVPQIVSLRALTPVSAARFERQQLRELFRDSPRPSFLFSTMSAPTHMAQDVARANHRRALTSSDRSTTPRVAPSAPSSAQIKSSTTGAYVDEPESSPLRSIKACRYSSHRPPGRRSSRLQDRSSATAVRRRHRRGRSHRHDSRRIRTSEGLRVLIIEQFAAGGQAGTSSGIENHLGLPSGISGPHRARLQASQRIWGRIVLERNVEELQPAERGDCVRLDGEDQIEARVSSRYWR